MSFNRLGNVGNKYQGAYKHVLCVCSAGLLRSPTAALVLARPPFDFNTRAAGLSEEFALIVVDEVLIAWADEIVCMSDSQRLKVEARVPNRLRDLKRVVSLGIPDIYAYRDPELMTLIAQKYCEVTPAGWSSGSSQGS